MEYDVIYPDEPEDRVEDSDYVVWERDAGGLWHNPSPVSNPGPTWKELNDGDGPLKPFNPMESNLEDILGEFEAILDVVAYHIRGVTSYPDSFTSDSIAIMENLAQWVNDMEDLLEA